METAQESGNEALSLHDALLRVPEQNFQPVPLWQTTDVSDRLQISALPSHPVMALHAQHSPPPGFPLSQGSQLLKTLSTVAACLTSMLLRSFP
jgi:hypothetical protein